MAYFDSDRSHAPGARWRGAGAAGWLAGLAAVALAVPGIAAAKPTAAKTAAKPAAAAESPKTAQLSPEAKAALRSMSEYLRSLQSFEVTADGTGEVVDKFGQKLEFGAQLHYLVGLPDKLFAEVTTGERHRQIYYDGHKLTVVAVGAGYYTDVPMTGALPDLLAKASEEYGIELPLQALFRWGDTKRPIAYPLSGFKVGTAKCGTATCDQYAYRQAGLDWQLWLRQGDKPLPVRLVFTDVASKARPQIAADLTWNTATVAADRFAYVPAEGAQRIPIKPIAASAGSK